MTIQRRPDPTTATRASGNLLLIAAREPTAGQTKTRLGASIGMENAATLYRAFLSDLAERFTPNGASRGYAFGWAFSPPTCDFAVTIKKMGYATADSDVLFVPQDGPDWGTRQTNLLRWGRDHGFARTVLTASDSPHMPLSVIFEAFGALESHDVALGRVHDGGYYLIGMSGFHDILSNVPMSTASAADALVLGARATGLSIKELRPTFDVDTEDDLDQLRDFVGRDPNAAPATARTLSELGLMRGSLAARRGRGD